MASVIDSFVIILIYGVVWYLASLILFWPILFITPFISAIYFVAMEGGDWHATLGKRVMSLYVSDAMGNGVTYSGAFLRVIGKMLTGFTLGLGYLTCFFNGNKQCLHDMIAKTFVLEGRAGSDGEPSIVCVSGPMAGFRCRVGDNGVAIGRDSLSCQVVLPNSQTNVSRVHCFVSYNPVSGMFVLSDRNSTSGTFLSNGRRIYYSQPAALRRGDRFYLATPENTFEVI